MNGHEEQITRLALKRRRKLGSLSDEAFAELELAVREDPSNFVDDDEEQAFSQIVAALDRYHDSCRDDDLLDDEQYAIASAKRYARLESDARKALSIDPDCVDAMLIASIAQETQPDAFLDQLVDYEKMVNEEFGSIPRSATGDTWTDVFMHPRLRLSNSIAYAFFTTARYRMAIERCCDLLAISPLDALGSRFVCALAMARLEDERGLDWLDARDKRRGNAWMHLSRVLLMYKLGRMPAARRALRGFDSLCPGGAYALLQPMFVDKYLPDRPTFTPQTFTETLLSVHEASFVINDVPDFPHWASNLSWFWESAHDFCHKNGFEWRDWE